MGCDGPALSTQKRTRSPVPAGSGRSRYWKAIPLKANRSGVLAATLAASVSPPSGPR